MIIKLQAILILFPLVVGGSTLLGSCSVQPRVGSLVSIEWTSETEIVQDVVMEPTGSLLIYLSVDGELFFTDLLFGDELWFRGPRAVGSPGLGPLSKFYRGFKEAGSPHSISFVELLGNRVPLIGSLRCSLEGRVSAIGGVDSDEGEPFIINFELSTEMEDALSLGWELSQ